MIVLYLTQHLRNVVNPRGLLTSTASFLCVNSVSSSMLYSELGSPNRPEAKRNVGSALDRNDTEVDVPPSSTSAKLGIATFINFKRALYFASEKFICRSGRNPDTLKRARLNAEGIIEFWTERVILIFSNRWSEVFSVGELKASEQACKLSPIKNYEYTVIYVFRIS